MLGRHFFITLKWNFGKLNAAKNSQRHQRCHNNDVLKPLTGRSDLSIEPGREETAVQSLTFQSDILSFRDRGKSDFCPSGCVGPYAGVPVDGTSLSAVNGQICRESLRFLVSER